RRYGCKLLIIITDSVKRRRRIPLFRDNKSAPRRTLSHKVPEFLWVGAHALLKLLDLRAIGQLRLELERRVQHRAGTHAIVRVRENHSRMPEDFRFGWRGIAAHGKSNRLDSFGVTTQQMLNPCQRVEHRRDLRRELRGA